MVKAVISTVTMAMVAADDVSLLQLSAGVRQSQGQRILAAVAEEGNDTICVEAAVGDVAPVSGSFTSIMSQQTVVVAAGSVAGEAGSFCVAKQDVLLIQRTFGLNTARDFEAALGSKNNKATTTTTTMDWDNFDWKERGDPTKEVKMTSETCQFTDWDQEFYTGTKPPNDSLVQTVEESVSNKQPDKKDIVWGPDHRRVCECRKFLKSTVDTPNFSAELGKLRAAMATAAAEAEAEVQRLAQQRLAQQRLVKQLKAEELLQQRNFDAALASKNTANKATTTTTTTTTTIDRKLTAEFAPLATACTAASRWGPWWLVARELNNPAYAELFQSFNITGGWQHCDKSWVVQGACGEFVTVAPTDQKDWFVAAL